jgi:hypothetical protein
MESSLNYPTKKVGKHKKYNYNENYILFALNVSILFLLRKPLPGPQRDFPSRFSPCKTATDSQAMPMMKTRPAFPALKGPTQP